MDIEVKILDPRLAVWGLPRYATEHAAAIDLHACIDAPLALAPASPPALIPAGFALLMGDPHVAALVLPRSGLGHKRGLVLGNLVAPRRPLRPAGVRPHPPARVPGGRRILGRHRPRRRRLRLDWLTA